MGKLEGETKELGLAKETTFTGTANGGWFEMSAEFNNYALWGTFVGTFKLQCSFDGGTNAIDIPNASFTAPTVGGIVSREPGVLYRWVCSAYTSGTATARLSTGGSSR